ncbi:hypothetical protein LguiA_026227 [Lonicera macranthoides]
MAREMDYGAFMEKFTLQPLPSTTENLALNNLTFTVKDIFDVDGYVTGFGNPDWARTHSAATSTAPSVLALLAEGATCVGKTVMDEMAYRELWGEYFYCATESVRMRLRVIMHLRWNSELHDIDFGIVNINGENVHYGTPTNPRAPDRVPGGSSSGSAVSVGATLVDFSLGWFARDPLILNRIGQVLLQLPHVDPVTPTNIIIAEDCFKLLSIPSDRVTKVLIKSIDKIFGGHIVNYASIGDYVESKVPSLKRFMVKGVESQEYSIESLTALSSAMRSLQRCGSTSTRLSWDFYVYTFSDLHDNCDIGRSFIMYKSAYFFLLLFMLWSLITYLLKHRYEFKNNHGEWVSTVKPDLGPGISERVWEALQSTDENIDACHPVKNELRSALTALLGDYGILVIPSVPGPPPKLKTEPSTLETFRARAFSLLSIAGVSGFCQVSIPLGMYDNLPVSVSLLAKHGSDGFLLNVVETIYGTLKEHVEIAENLSY